MNSPSASVIANIVAVLGGVAGVGSVHQTPVDREAWLASFMAAPLTRTPAVHVGLRSTTLFAGDTDGGEDEILHLRLSVVQAHTDTTLADILAVRDAIFGDLFSTSNLAQGGYAETTDLTGWEVETDQGSYTIWHIDLDVLTTWERDA